MAFDPISNEERLVREAVRRAKPPGGTFPLSAASKPVNSALGQVDTAPVVDVDNNVHTGHVFMLGVDALGDTYSYLGAIV